MENVFIDRTSQGEEFPLKCDLYPFQFLLCLCLRPLFCEFISSSFRCHFFQLSSHTSFYRMVGEGLKRKKMHLRECQIVILTMEFMGEK